MIPSVTLRRKNKQTKRMTVVSKTKDYRGKNVLHSCSFTIYLLSESILKYRELISICKETPYWKKKYICIDIYLKLKMYI